MPRLRAYCSPINKALRGFTNINTASKVTSATPPNTRVSLSVVDPKEPMPQTTNDFKLPGSAKYSSALSKAPHNCENIKPTNSKITLLVIFLDTAKIKSVTATLPAMAANIFRLLP